MPQVTITDREGNPHTIDGRSGETLMQTITHAGMAELLALCGGMCSCATCHVYVDDEFLGMLSPVNEDENELLEASDHRRPNSRLSCQIRMTDELEGLRATIAPED